MTRKVRTIIMVVSIALLAVATLATWWLVFRPVPLPEGLIQANGRIEGDHYTVASKVPGRIVELMAREGDDVKGGQILTRLDDTQVRAKVKQAQAAVEAFGAQFKAARISIATLKKRVPLQLDTAKAGVAHADAALAAARASAEQAARVNKRFSTLLKTHTVDKDSAEHKELAWTVARAEYATAMAALTQAEKKQAEAELGWEQIEAKEQEVAVFEAQLKQAQAALVEAQSVQDDLAIYAPASGIITTRIVDEGEVVAAGSPQFDIVDLDRLYLKVYIAEKEIGKVRLGLSARIYTDAFPDKPFAAKVRYIASRAEFTPKEVQTPDERVKLVYAVKLHLNENPDRRLTPGLPADAVIRWQEETPWAKPRW
ncbi:MAG: efflux RND transporter periplasmic adaptor subunit [Proteobacteria bacterium]|nr:efflux RND transporter periplasmic adaptor subunit [Pseudomonadota bacterium]